MHMCIARFQAHSSTSAVAWSMRRADHAGGSCMCDAHNEFIRLAHIYIIRTSILIRIVGALCAIFDERWMRGW